MSSTSPFAELVFLCPLAVLGRLVCGCRRSLCLLCLLAAAGSLLLAIGERGSAQSTSEVHGRVLDTAGLPVAGAVVRLEPARLEARSGADGRYAIVGIRPGPHHLSASAPGFNAPAVEVRTPREGERLRVDVVLQPEVVQVPGVTTLVERQSPDALRHVLTREEIRRAGSVADALGRVPGVFVKEFGAGGAREVTIRGGGPDQTLVLWGNERLLNTAGGGLDVAALSTAGIDSIEVITRGASSRYGAGALGGVVRIYPSGVGAVAAEPGLRAFETRVGIGSLGRRDAAVSTAVGVGSAFVTAAGAARGVERSFGRPESTGGDEWQGALGIRVPRLAAAVDVLAQRSQRDAPGPVVNPSPRARSTQERLLLSASAGHRVQSLDVRAEGSLQVSEFAFSDPDRAAAGAESRETAVTARLGAHAPRASHELDGELELRSTRLSAPSSAGRPSRRDLGLRLGDRFRVPSSRLTLVPELRLDVIDVDAGGEAVDGAAEGVGEDGPGEGADTFLSPSLSAAIQLGEGVAVHAHAGRSFRYPDFQSLFFVSGVGVRSNPALREERSRDLELGVSWTAPHQARELTASLVVFDRRIEGAIVWLPDFQFIWMPRNLSRAVARGVEISGSWRPHPRWRWQTSYTYAPARFDLPGNEHPLPYRPAHMGRVEASFEGRVLRSALEARLTGRRFPNLAGTNALDGYVLLDWSAAYHWDVAGGEMALELGFENLLDRRYDVVFAFPAAGRLFHAALSFRR